MPLTSVQQSERERKPCPPVLHHLQVGPIRDRPGPERLLRMPRGRHLRRRRLLRTARRRRVARRRRFHAAGGLPCWLRPGARRGPAGCGRMRRLPRQQVPRGQFVGSGRPAGGYVGGGCSGIVLGVRCRRCVPRRRGGGGAGRVLGGGGSCGHCCGEAGWRPGAAAAYRPPVRATPDSLACCESVQSCVLRACRLKERHIYMIQAISPPAGIDAISMSCTALCRRIAIDLYLQYLICAALGLCCKRNRSQRKEPPERLSPSVLAALMQVSSWSVRWQQHLRQRPRGPAVRRVLARVSA